MANSVKVTVVGNSLVGKSTLMLHFKDGVYSENPPPRVEEFIKNITVDGAEYQLTCTDTRSTEAEDRMRPLSYPNTNIFLITFSFTDASSFANVANQWIKELTHHSVIPTPFFLVGLKADGERRVSEEDVKALLSRTDKIEETFYISSKTDKGVKELLSAVSKGAVKHLKAQGVTTITNDPEIGIRLVKRRTCEIL